jgi:hypothetical protein
MPGIGEGSDMVITSRVGKRFELSACAQDTSSSPFVILFPVLIIVVQLAWPGFS